MFKAAVVGLGNIGFRFNLDPKRTDTWSHISAYEKCRRTKLVGAVEIDDDKIKSFTEMHKGVPVFKSVDELFRNTEADLVSVCTPTSTHYPILKQLLRYPIKGVFCEKPITQSVKDGKEMIRLCDRAGVKLAVNHTRRWQNSYLSAAEMIGENKIGNVKAVHAFYPGQVFNIGTHLFDAVRMMIRKDAISMSGASENSDAADPNISGWIKFDGGIVCTIGTNNKREDLVFEIDVIGTEGRIKVLENGEKIEWYIFDESRNSTGYRELVPKPFKQPKRNDRLADAVENICDAMSGKDVSINCSGRDGLEALIISCLLVKSAKNNGKVIQKCRD